MTSRLVKTEVPNLSLTMYPFSISTDEHIPLKFLMTKKTGRNTLSKSTEVLTELLYVRIFGKKYFFLLNVPLQIRKCTPRGTCTPGWEPLDKRFTRDAVIDLWTNAAFTIEQRCLGNLRPAWTFDMARMPYQNFRYPVLEHKIASKRSSIISRYLESKSREVTISHS